jgi:hypothetical protein
MSCKQSGIPSDSLTDGAKHGQGVVGEIISIRLQLDHISKMVQNRADTLELAFAANITVQHRRLLNYVNCYPEAFTHQIARDCGIGNVSCRAGELNRRALHGLGLSLEGRRQSGHVNRFGEPNGEYRWNIIQAV